MSRCIPVGPFPHYYAIVDDEDYEWLSQFNWAPQISRNITRDTIYAMRHQVPERAMHKFLVDYPMVDHKNGIGLDNRKENLREATLSQNQMNKIKQATCNGNPTSSKFKGVCYDKSRSKWQAHIGLNSKIIRLGRFTDEVEAAQAYDRKAIELFGNYARLNFPREGY